MAKSRWVLSMIVLLAVAFFCNGCGVQQAQPVPGKSSPEPANQVAAVDAAQATKQIIWEAYDKVLTEVQEGNFPVDPVKAVAMIKGREAAHFIVDLRSPEDYAKKHVKGAVNLGIVRFAENIDRLPPDKTLVLYCYTGQSSALAMAPLKAYGYKAVFINGGFPLMEEAGFTMDTEMVAFAPVERKESQDLKLVAALTGVRQNLIAIAKQHAVKTLVVSQTDTKELVEGSPDKYAFVDLRPKTDYDRGHIKGSISAPLAELKSKAGTLPKEKRLILCCKSGQLAAMATAPLTAEGFKIISLCSGFSQAEENNFPMEKKP